MEYQRELLRDDFIQRWAPAFQKIEQHHASMNERLDRMYLHNVSMIDRMDRMQPPSLIEIAPQIAASTVPDTIQHEIPPATAPTPTPDLTPPMDPPGNDEHLTTPTEVISISTELPLQEIMVEQPPLKMLIPELIISSEDQLKVPWRPSIFSFSSVEDRYRLLEKEIILFNGLAAVYDIKSISRRLIFDPGI